MLLKCMLGSQDKLKTCQGQYETMELLKTIDTRYMQEGFLVREVQPQPYLLNRNLKYWRMLSVMFYCHFENDETVMATLHAKGYGVN